MGHIRLGRIPKTQTWRAVFEALNQETVHPADLARATSLAVEKELSGLERDQAVNYCFWILVRLATASRGDFKAGLQRIGVEPERVSSGFGFIQQVSQAVEKELRRRGDSSVFVRIAELTLREVLSANIIEQSRSLFGTTLEDVKSACRAISTSKGFGRAARDFYAAFVSRSIQYLADKELSNHIGPTKPIASPKQALEFQQSLDLYCYQTALIVEDFAGGWFSKNNWEQNNDISEQASIPFTSYALQKIQMELREKRK